MKLYNITTVSLALSTTSSTIGTAANDVMYSWFSLIPKGIK
jgi:hypothetical protein